MDLRRGRQRRGVFYRLRFLSEAAQQWCAVVPFISWLLVIGISALVPLFVIRYQKAAEETSKFSMAWRPWYQRDLPGAYLDDEVDIPRILLWSVPSHQWENDEPLQPRGERVLQSCLARNDQRTCFVTRDRDYLRRADAVLFDVNTLDYFDYPTIRHQGQVWAVRIQGDPPLYPTYDLIIMATKFNWTISYRGDAALTIPYRKWGPPPMGLPDGVLKQVMRKSKVAVWLVSECEADRIAEAAVFRVGAIRNDFEFANLIASASDAEIIEDCGGEACRNHHECLKSLQNVYFFLIVVESSPCFEHPHQLLFDALQYSIIPIYFGSSSLGSTVPPSSVFEATEAASAQDVITSVSGIFSNLERYLGYMKWKERYGIFVPRNFLCAVCDALYENRSRTTNDDVLEWWRLGSECKELPTDRVYPIHAKDALQRHS